MKFTLADFQPTSTRLYLKHPSLKDANGERLATEHWLELVGFESPRVHDVQRNFRAKQLSDGKANEDDPSELGKKLIAATIVNWDEDFFGEPCTELTRARFVNNPANEEVFRQISGFATEREHFFHSSPSNSANSSNTAPASTAEAKTA